MSSPSADRSTRLLGDDDRDSLRDDWRALEERFVDDPAGTVKGADDLIATAIDRIRAALDDHRVSTRQRWSAIDDATTEQLREALHHYEVLLSRLTDLPLPGDGRDRAG